MEQTQVKASAKQANDALILLRDAAWNSLFVFTKTVLNYNLLEENPHRELCEYLEKAVISAKHIEVKFVPSYMTPSVKALPDNNKILLMVPRGCFKSTIASTAVPIWLLWHNPNLRIMLDCATLSNAKLYVSAIKDQIENNEILRMIAVNDKGEYILEPDKKAAGGWTEDRILLKHRTKLGLKEPSLFVSAVDNNRTGMHPDVIIMDDLVSETTVTTPDLRAKTLQHYRFSLSLLERGGLQVVIGTRYHMDDLYNVLLDNPGFNCIVRPAILPNGKLYFPAKYTKETLEELKRDQGAEIFNSQYMLNPVNEEDATFKIAKLNYYSDDDFKFIPGVNENPVKFAQIFVLTDLAIGQNKNNDNTVIMVVGITCDKKIYILDYIWDKLVPSQQINGIFQQYDLARSYGYVRGVGIETVAYQKAMLYLVKDEARRRGTSIPLLELRPVKDKTLRINAIVPLVDNGDIYISPKHKELVEEMRQFPYGKHDDIIDTLAYIIQVLRPGQYNSKGKHIYEYKPKVSSITNY